MPTEKTAPALELKNAGRTIAADPARLTLRSREFLEQYVTPALVGREFCEIVGTGDGGERFARLLDAAGFAAEPEAFFRALLPLLAEPGAPQRSLNALPLPHLYLMALLEELLPGNGFVSVRSVDHLIELTNSSIPDEDREALEQVIETYPVRLSRHTIRQMMVSPDVAYQYMPFVEELDSVGHTNTWIGQFHQGLLEQMYQNRVIFLLNMACPVYCRFCFRKHKDSRNEACPTPEDVGKAIDHVGTSPSIKEIVVTGGDPFLHRANMEATIDGLMEIDHVQTVRLATRSVAYYPDLFLRQEGEYLAYLKQKSLELRRHGKRMELATHFIHPDEVSPAALSIISELTAAGIVVYIQTPFLKGCNDQGPELVRLFRLLRGAGAEMHYIYIPCSPIHGNSVYWAPLSEGIDVAEHLRAHLSDRSVPKICTATPIGKMEWYTSGRAVEPVEDNPDFLWIRTPYTPAYFKSFAPLASELPNIRVNGEGTLDIQYMAKIGKEEYYLGSRPLRISRTAVPGPKPEFLTAEALRGLLRGTPIVETGVRGVLRLHETRVEIDEGAGDEQLDYIRRHPLISDVVVAPSGDLPSTLYGIGRIAAALKEIPHVNALRIRSHEFAAGPELFTRETVRRIGELNRLTVANPLRVEIESWFFAAGEVTEQHAVVTRRLAERGVSVYANTPLLGGFNDSPDEIGELTYAYRRAGIEFHHLYVAGHPLQREWNGSRPVDMYDVVDIASRIRREGSGREGPRYILQTPLGEVYYGLTSSFIHTEEGIRVRLDSYDLPYYREMDPDYRLPEGVEIDADGKPVIAISGLTSSTGFRI